MQVSSRSAGSAVRSSSFRLNTVNIRHHLLLPVYHMKTSRIVNFLQRIRNGFRTLLTFHPVFATIPSNNKEGVDNPIMCDTGDCDPKPPLTDMCLTAGHSLHLRE